MVYEFYMVQEYRRGLCCPAEDSEQMIFRKVLVFLAGIVAFFRPSPSPGEARPGAKLNWHDGPLPGIDGQPRDPGPLTGQVVLCVPSRDFRAQEPDSESRINGFCQTTYGVNFPMLAKHAVSGPGAFPLYRRAARRTEESEVPRWNFHKLLMGRDGNLLGWFVSGVTPDAEPPTQAVQTALAQPGPTL